MIARQCLPELLERPFRCGMGSDVLMENLAGSDLHHDQDVEGAERGGDHYEEVAGHHDFGMVADEGQHSQIRIYGNHNLLRDRDRIFGQEFVKQVKAMGIQQVLSAPRSPWQRAYVERVIGTIRRECLDHLIVFNERSLHRHLQAFVDYYHRNRVHLALEKDTPEPRLIQPPERGRIVSIQVLGGLHHRYERRAA